MSDGDYIQIPFQPGLGRHIAHDPRNRMFQAQRTATVPATNVRHRHFGAKLNQGNIGACTGFAGANCINTMPIRGSIRPKPTMTNDNALAFYRGATSRDPFPGAYPPDDSGSSGLYVCQEMQAEGLITSYEWAFGFQHGLEAIGLSPLMQGTYWTEDMFNPEADGRVRPTGQDAGGHEYTWVGIEYRSSRQPSTNRSWFLNSWGLWGKSGYFYMTWDDHEALLNRDGDLIRPVA